ncbi:MAG: bacteriohopanetetrol glucosamine biosynthesis glycosyltransferase HpnI [Rubritepida sp.]|nr:bacteriohopanetetrol glucosamine biosynthesis glycosyltransferase HpnI [Rubritepida sp.]
MVILALLMAVPALAGAVLSLAALRAFRRLASGGGESAGPARPVSLLKPLHGDEPRLARNLAAALAQRHAAPFEVLFGTARAEDAARPVAAAAVAASATPARLFVTGAPLGPNRKISQLLHLAAAARHPWLVIGDSDLAAPPGWLTALSAPLEDPGVGLVTALWVGVPGDGGPWSRLAVMGTNWHFVPFAAFGEALGQARGVYGPSMAIRAETLAAIGGFERFLPLLADDYALGEAVRAAGLRVALAPVLPGQVLHERSFASLWAHELRWARTIRLVRPGGHLGLAFTQPLPFALAALALAPGVATLALLGLVLAARLALARGMDRATGAAGWRRLLWLPARDLLTFAVWLAAFARGGVAWRGERFTLAADGRMAGAGGPARGAPHAEKEGPA